MPYHYDPNEPRVPAGRRDGGQWTTDRYGEKGSIRVDVLENRGNGTVCVYDIKTGQSGLSPARMAEIAGTVFRTYAGTKRIIVTEIRPGVR